MSSPASNRSLDPGDRTEPGAIAHPRMNHICMSRKGRLTHAIRKLIPSCRGKNAQPIENVTLKRNATDILRVFNKMIHFQAIEIFSIEPFVMLDIGGVCREKLVRIRLLNWRQGGTKGEGCGCPNCSAKGSAAPDSGCSSPEPRAPIPSRRRVGRRGRKLASVIRKSECCLFS